MSGQQMGSRVLGQKDWTWGVESGSVADGTNSSFYEDDEDEEEAVYRYGLGAAGDLTDDSEEEEEDDEEGAAAGGSGRYGASPETEPMLGGGARRGGSAPVAAATSKKKAPLSSSSGANKSKKQQPASAADVARRNELARKNAAREALRRKAEKRVYKPASVWIIGKLMVMYGGFVALLYVDVFLTALACYVNPAAKSMDALGDYAWNCLCCFCLLGLPALAVHLAGYVFLPPVWGESFPEREKVLEELGGKLYFRFHWWGGGRCKLSLFDPCGLKGVRFQIVKKE